jgi:hypothetical protein
MLKAQGIEMPLVCLLFTLKQANSRATGGAISASTAKPRSSSTPCILQTFNRNLRTEYAARHTRSVPRSSILGIYDSSAVAELPRIAFPFLFREFIQI